MSVLEVSLAGLLHDVGLVAARGFDGPEGVNAQTLTKVAELTGRSAGDWPTPVLYSLDFVFRMPYLPAGLDKERIAGLLLEDWSGGQSAASPLAQAHRLFGAVPTGPTFSAGRPQPTRLVAVASQIRTPDGSAPPAAWVPLAELSPLVAFPLPAGQPVAQTLVASPAEYRRLWEHLLQAWAENRCPDPAGFISRALSILE